MMRHLNGDKKDCEERGDGGKGISVDIWSLACLCICPFSLSMRGFFSLIFCSVRAFARARLLKTAICNT